MKFQKAFDSGKPFMRKCWENSPSSWMVGITKDYKAFKQAYKDSTGCKLTAVYASDLNATDWIVAEGW